MALQISVPMRIKCLVVTLFAVMFSSDAYAVKSIKLAIGKEQPLVIEVPPAKWSKKELSWSGSVPIFVLRSDETFIRDKNWEDGTLPSLIEFYIEKAQECGSGVMTGRIVGCPVNWSQVELRSSSAWVKIQFSPEVGDIEAALRQIAFLGTIQQFEDTDYLREKVFKPHQAEMFVALPNLKNDDRYELFKFGVAKRFTISSAKFKGKSYLEMSVPISVTFNTIRVDQDQRVAGIVKEMILPNAKQAFRIVEGKSIDGLAFLITIPAYNFVTGGESKFDNLAVYITLEELKAFSENDITSQKLLNESIVLLNEDRIEVKL